jgi:microsomal dipeptidase-like Zn-dependent dipeptidase
MSSPGAGSRPAGGSLVIDAHGHGTRVLPRLVQAVRRATVRSHPADSPLTELAQAGVDAVIVNAVGDRLVTRWWWPADPWAAVRRQLDEMRAEAETAGCRLATTTADIRTARDAGRAAVVLGLEGADVVGEGPDTACRPPRGRGSGHRPGPLRRQRLGHDRHVLERTTADRATTLAVCERTSAPAICSHTGARSLHDFPRYLGDDEIRAVSATGGLVGLWPFRHKGKGIVDPDDFARHADHLARTAGLNHVCIGTDMNGVPGLMTGYRGERDFPTLIPALQRTGFSDDEIAGIASGNIWRAYSRPSAADQRLAAPPGGECQPAAGGDTRRVGGG